MIIRLDIPYHTIPYLQTKKQLEATVLFLLSMQHRIESYKPCRDLHDTTLHSICPATPTLRGTLNAHWIL